MDTFNRGRAVSGSYRQGPEGPAMKAARTRETVAGSTQKQAVRSRGRASDTEARKAASLKGWLPK